MLLKRVTVGRVVVGLEEITAKERLRKRHELANVRKI